MYSGSKAALKLYEFYKSFFSKKNGIATVGQVMYWRGDWTKIELLRCAESFKNKKLVIKALMLQDPGSML